MGNSVISRGWLLGVPMLGIVVATLIPFVRHAQQTRAESAASAFLGRVHAGQQAFRVSHGNAGYASALDSLTMPCRGGNEVPIRASDVAALERAAYDAILRPAQLAVSAAKDCHGRPLVSDYYAAVSPRSVQSPGRQAFAVTATGRIFVFFDGIAPLERDMAGGLATPLDALDTFKIP